MSRSRKIEENLIAKHPMHISEQVIILFDILRDKHGSPYSMREISLQTGITLGGLSKLRSGNIDNPTLSTLRSLCLFFGIQLDYFNCATREDCYAYLAEHKPDDFKMPGLAVLLREQGLSDKSVSYILDIVSHLRDLEGEGNLSVTASA